MHPHRKARKPNQKVFAPALKRSDALTAYPLQVEFAVAFNVSNYAARKRSDLLAQNDNRRALRHTRGLLALVDDVRIGKWLLACRRVKLTTCLAPLVSVERRNGRVVIKLGATHSEALAASE